MSFQPIENYGVIGNMRSIALVGMNGSIDFLCYPRFDSPSVFAALLDDQRGGRFQIQPELDHRQIRQLYLPDTNILLTRFLAEEGVAEITDFMPIGIAAEQPNEIVRMVSVVRGEVRFQSAVSAPFQLRAVRAHAHLACETRRVRTATGLSSPHGALLHRCPPARRAGCHRSIHPARWREGNLHIRSHAASCRASRNGESRKTLPRNVTLLETLDRKVQPQRPLARDGQSLRPHAEASDYREYGSLIAAPTFSLPEDIGGVRNWDYRYTWLRDAAFTLYALIRLGFVDEMEAFIGWIKDRLSDNAERGPLQVMYGVDGRTKLDESTLDHLQGYENSRPVRIGNAAYQQLQLDIYGEMMDSIYLANKYGDAISYAGWQDVQRILAWLGQNWQRPDEGIWEVRGGRREFLHSRLMSWVAFDRALRLAEKRSLSGPLQQWFDTRDAIRADIFTNFWDDQLQSFVQSKGTKDLDASVLLMPLMRFISPVDPMWLSTMRAIESRPGRRHSGLSLRRRALPRRRITRTRRQFHRLLVLVHRMSRKGR